MEDHARDSNSGLLYHGWDESRNASWANPSTGTSPEFWARSLGWYMMALVDVLDFIPQENTAQRDTILAILNRLVSAVSDVQDQVSGVWWQVPDKGGQSGNWQESSSTAMFVYAIAKAVRHNYIDPGYLSTVEKGWNGLINEFVTTSGSNLNLIDTCEGTGVGGSYSFYIGRAKKTNDPKGLGPFLMAAVEVELSDADINRPPIISNAIYDMSLLLNDPAVEIDLNTVFIDPNGDTLSFSHSASPGTDNNVSLSGSTLIITPNELGSVVHSLTANDGNGGRVTLQFTLTVVSSYSPVLTSAPTPVPTLSPGEEYSIVLQAEDQTWSNATVDTYYPGYNGTGYVNTANNISEWVEFSVNLLTTGSYHTGLRYNSRRTSAMEVRVNGELQISNLDFPSTGGWMGLSWSVREFSLQLQAGENQIRFVSLNRRGAPNLDELGLLGDEVSENRPPNLNAPIGSQNLIQGEPALYIDLNNVFSDPDGDSLSFSVSPSANASISGNELVLESSVVGSENLVVTADDNRGGIATDQFDFTVTGANRAPIVQSTISDITMTMGDPVISINLNDVFIDPDGDSLSFSHVAENSNDSNVQLNGTALELTPVEVSSVSHTVYADDGNGGQAETAFVVNVIDVVVLGDVNGDGSIDIVDALQVAQYYVGEISENIDITAADTNCDNIVDIVDALLIAQYFVGLISSFCS